MSPEQLLRGPVGQGPGGEIWPRVLALRASWGKTLSDLVFPNPAYLGWGLPVPSTIWLHKNLSSAPESFQVI